ncbi:radical S-adenosyl methionine domain-containing protein 1 [Podila humilis]|nr:radical S-adenosyl methionine domain-containing protein 1 [Podila humilis]
MFSRRVLGITTSGYRPFSTTRNTNAANLATSKEPYSIYIHWPYCSSKCTYCNFNKYVDPNVDNDRMEKALVKELVTELQHWGLDKTRPVRSIYFGGGTPSLARSTTSLESLVQLRDLGITRYSLGIQSFQDQILKDLGRDHSATSALRSLLDAKKVWPGHVSMDLIMGHRGQTLQDWERELCFTMDIIDDHLSLYHLTIEPGTDLYKNVRAGLVSVPDHDSATDMYEAIIKITEAVGFEHYEVSNFARNKAYSQHNSGHWLGIDYLGIGPGAHGRVTDPVSGQRVRTFNIRDPSSWMTHCEETGTG